MNEINESETSGEDSVCDHKWVVFSTAIEDVCLMVHCVICGAHGSVDDPSREEWSEAFHAPSRPYDWSEGHRVNVRGVLPKNKWHAKKERFERDSAISSQEPGPHFHEALEELREIVKQGEPLPEMITIESDDGVEVVEWRTTALREHLEAQP